MFQAKKKGTSYPVPVIHHIGRRQEDSGETAHHAAWVLKLSLNDERLLWFYAQCEEGERPTAREIEEKAHVPAEKLYFYRGRLVEKGCVQYAPGVVNVLWNEIRKKAQVWDEMERAELERYR